MSLINEIKDGVLIYVICRICSNSTNERYAGIFDILLARIEILDEEAFQFKSKIKELIKENHTDNWENIYKDYIHKLNNSNKKQTAVFSMESDIKKLRKWLEIKKT